LAEHSLNYHAQAVRLTGLKQERSSLSEIHSQVLQNVAVRVDLAFKAFFRQVKAGDRPGYPRFKGRGWCQQPPAKAGGLWLQTGAS
jgi:putative transposase